MVFGCHIANECISILAYADDMLLMAPSWFGLQKLLYIIEDSAKIIGLSFNINKTVCMIFDPYKSCKIVNSSFPHFTLSGAKLEFVDQFKYLGHIIDKKLSDNADIRRETKSLFYRTNVLLNKFKNCSIAVKVKLFRSYSICLYGCALWTNLMLLRCED